jgi:hypothetical protein
MEYNTQRSQIVIPEYGRNIHKMINHAFTIENREERNNVAHSIVKVMGQVKPQFKEADDFIQRLWDHMIIISDFKLDVDSPYPYPEKEELLKKPNKMKYPTTRIRFRHYGKAIENFIKKAIAMEDGEEKDSFTYYIANVMKKNYLMYNRDSVNDQLIFDQLSLLSNSKLELKDTFTLQKTSDLITRTKPSPTKVSQRRNTSGAQKKGKKTFRKNNR